MFVRATKKSGWIGVRSLGYRARCGPPNLSNLSSKPCDGIHATSVATRAGPHETLSGENDDLIAVVLRRTKCRASSILGVDHATTSCNCAGEQGATITPHRAEPTPLPRSRRCRSLEVNHRQHVAASRIGATIDDIACLARRSRSARPQHAFLELSCHHLPLEVLQSVRRNRTFRFFLARASAHFLE